MNAYDECGHTWTDGWSGADDPHRCHLRDDHDGTVHRCACGATTPTTSPTSPTGSAA